MTFEMRTMQDVASLPPDTTWAVQVGEGERRSRDFRDGKVTAHMG